MALDEILFSKEEKYCKNCNKNGHNLTQCWYANITRKPKSKIRQAQSDEIVNRNLRKYATVDIFNNSIKFQLDSGLISQSSIGVLGGN